MMTINKAEPEVGPNRRALLYAAATAPFLATLSPPPASAQQVRPAQGSQTGPFWPHRTQAKDVGGAEGEAVLAEIPLEALFLGCSVAVTMVVAEGRFGLRIDGLATGLVSHPRSAALVQEPPPTSFLPSSWAISDRTHDAW